MPLSPQSTYTWLHTVMEKAHAHANALTPDPELDLFTSTTKYTWQEVADSDELSQFLTEVRCGVHSSSLG